MHIFLHERRVATTKKEKPSPILVKFLRQSQPGTYEPETKKVKRRPNME